MCGRRRRTGPLIGRERELAYRGRVVSNHGVEHRTELLRHACNSGVIEQPRFDSPASSVLSAIRDT